MKHKKNAIYAFVKKTQGQGQKFKIYFNVLNLYFKDDCFRSKSAERNIL